MYKFDPAQLSTGNKLSISKYVQDYDIFNSELLLKLNNVTEVRYYLITRYEQRTDLIAKDIYGDSDYEWFIIFINRAPIKDYLRGRYIKYIPKEIIDAIIDSL